MPLGRLKTPFLTTCKACNTEFEAVHYASSYCSKKCKHKSQYSRQRDYVLDKDYQLRKVYGISLEDYARMVDAQNHSCAICGKVTEKLFVDHCHSSGVIRGLLCINCNTGLGHFKDDPKILKEAIKYIKDLKSVKGE